MRRAIAVFAGVLDIDRHARKIFDHDLARQTRVAARSAGGDDQLLEGEQRALDGMQFAGKDDVVLQMLLDGLRNGRRLLVDFPPHGVRMLLVGRVLLCFRRSHRQGLRVNHFRVQR